MLLWLLLLLYSSHYLPMGPQPYPVIISWLPIRYVVTKRHQGQRVTSCWQPATQTNRGPNRDKKYATLQATALTNIKTVRQISLLHIESSLDLLGLLSPTHDQRSQQQSGQIQPVLIIESKFLKATHRTEVRKICQYVYIVYLRDGTNVAASSARGRQLNREHVCSPMSSSVPANLVSRDSFGRPVPRQPAHILPTQATNLCLLSASLPLSATTASVSYPVKCHRLNPGLIRSRNNHCVAMASIAESPPAQSQ